MNPPIATDAHASTTITLTLSIVFEEITFNNVLKPIFSYLQASISGESAAACQHIETDMEDGSSDDEMYEEESEDDDDMDETKGRLAWDKDV